MNRNSQKMCIRDRYFDDTLAAGFAGQNQTLTTLSAMLRRNVKTDAAVQAARTVNRQKVPVYQADLTMIQNLSLIHI